MYECDSPKPETQIHHKCDSFSVMANDDDDDWLAELLSYNCPVTGHKRTAGSFENHVDCPKTFG